MSGAWASVIEGTRVTHIVPSMMNHAIGRVTEYAGKKYGVHYWWVEYVSRRKAKERTAWAEFVLVIV